MKKLFNKKNVLFSFCTFFIIIASVVLFILFTDNYTDAKFRTMQDKIASSESVDLTGLRELPVSGGPPTDFQTLKKKLGFVNKPIILVDGTQEQHGYINGIPMTFFGYYCKKPSLTYFIRRLFFTGSLYEQPALVVKEQELAKKYGIGYTSIKVRSRFLTPNAVVDKFVSFIDKNQKNVWFHFHCRHGKGRTSLMLVMADIMQNAPKVALKDIIKRQYLLGSEDLFDTVLRENSTYSEKQLKIREKFIQDFYAFISQRKAGGIQLWSEWNNRKNNG